MASQKQALTAPAHQRSPVLVTAAEIRDKALFENLGVLSAFHGNTVGTSGAKVVYEKPPTLEHMDRPKEFKLAKFREEALKQFRVVVSRCMERCSFVRRWFLVHVW